MIMNKCLTIHMYTSRLTISRSANAKAEPYSNTMNSKTVEIDSTLFRTGRIIGRTSLDSKKYIPSELTVHTTNIPIKQISIEKEGNRKIEIDTKISSYITKLRKICW